MKKDGVTAFILICLGGILINSYFIGMVIIKKLNIIIQLLK